MSPACLVHIVDDDPAIRDALQDLLASVGLASQAHASTEAFLAHPPHPGPACLILDVRMPGQNGLAFHQQLKASERCMPVIFITGHGDIAMGVQAMKNGALEFLTKPFRDQELIDAVHQGLALDQQQRALREAEEALAARWATLTAREQQVARMVVQGQLNKQIAAHLHLSEITIKVRRAQAMRKMGAASLPELVRQLEKLPR